MDPKVEHAIAQVIGIAELILGPEGTPGLIEHFGSVYGVTDRSALDAAVDQVLAVQRKVRAQRRESGRSF